MVNPQFSGLCWVHAFTRIRRVEFQPAQARPDGELSSAELSAHADQGALYCLRIFWLLIDNASERAIESGFVNLNSLRNTANSEAYSADDFTTIYYLGSD